MDKKTANYLSQVMQSSIIFQSTNPNTIEKVLARKLGRQPTHAELKAEVERILFSIRKNP